jgi:hypothetical protein
VSIRDEDRHEVAVFAAAGRAVSPRSGAVAENRTGRKEQQMKKQQDEMQMFLVHLTLGRLTSAS